MYQGSLKKTKQIIMKDKKSSIALLIWLLLCFAIMLYVAIKSINPLDVFLLLAISLGILFSIKCIKNNNHLLNQLSSIEKNNSVSKTVSSTLHNPKVTFLTVPELRPRPNPSPSYYGIKITDDKKNKYYYFFEDFLQYDKESIKKISKKFKEAVHIQCYENTVIIKIIEKDPFFIHIRYGVLSE